MNELGLIIKSFKIVETFENLEKVNQFHNCGATTKTTITICIFSVTSKSNLSLILVTYLRIISTNYCDGNKYFLGHKVCGRSPLLQSSTLEI